MPYPCMQTSFSLPIAYTSSPPSRSSLILYLISLLMATQRSSSVTKNEERYVFSFPCTHIALAQLPVYTYPIYNKSIITTSPNTSLFLHWALLYPDRMPITALITDPGRSALMYSKKGPAALMGRSYGASELADLKFLAHTLSGFSLAPSSR